MSRHNSCSWFGYQNRKDKHSMIGVFVTFRYGDDFNAEALRKIAAQRT